MPIEWNEDLTTGIAAIDKQHKELFFRINSLMEAVGGGKGKEEAIRMIGFMPRYMDEHFRAEEEVMARFAYPDFEEHRAEHKRLKGKCAEFRGSLDIQFSTAHVIDLIQRVLSYLHEHVRTHDRKMAAYLRDNVKDAESIDLAGVDFF